MVRACAAVMVVAAALTGCGGGEPPSGGTVQEAAHDITSKRPWTAPMVKAILDEDLASRPEDLASMVLYFQMACTAQKTFGSDGTWSPQKIQQELSEHTDKQISDRQAEVLAATFVRMCADQPETSSG